MTTSVPRPNSHCPAPASDVGTPILTFHPGADNEASFFGPVISKAPTGDEAVETVGRGREAGHDVGHGRTQALDCVDTPDFT